MMHRKCLALTLIALAGFAEMLTYAPMPDAYGEGQSAQTFHSFAPTPPMGWNSWDCYGSSVVEEEVRANAAFMAKHLKPFGWEYVVVDIRWYVENPNTPPDRPYNQADPIYSFDEHGILTPAMNRFPSAKGPDGKNLGFKPLADDLHDQGLKFGVHLMRGINKRVWEADLPIAGSDFTTKDIERGKWANGQTDTGATWLRDNYGMKKLPAAQAYYDAMFAEYARWGVDYVKIDDMLRDFDHPDDSYYADEIEMIRAAIDKAGRPMVLSLSPGAAPLAKADHLVKHANLWRITDDLWDNWDDVFVMFERAKEWTPYRGPGHWPDNDMLPLGRLSIRGERGEFNRRSNLALREQRTLLTLWFITRSPLMYGGDLPHIEKDSDVFLFMYMTNPDAIAVNQASKNNHELKRSEDGSEVIWVADATGIHEGAKYVALFNRGDEERWINLTMSEIGYEKEDMLTITDVWKREGKMSGVEGSSEGRFVVPAHGSLLWRVEVE